MKTCPSCGKKFTDDKKFCNLDGTALILFNIPEEIELSRQTASEKHLKDNGDNSAVDAGSKVNCDIINNNETDNKINSNIDNSINNNADNRDRYDKHIDNDNINSQSAINDDSNKDIFSGILSKDTFFTDKNAAAVNKFKPAKITLKNDNILTNQFFDLNSESMIIGRFDQSTGNVDIDLSKIPNAEHISRKHAKFTFKNGKWSIEDINSTNGVFVKADNISEFSSRITEPAELKNGYQISFGDIIFLFNV